jgi:hypothetical protein
MMISSAGDGTRRLAGAAAADDEGGGSGRGGGRAVGFRVSSVKVDCRRASTQADRSGESVSLSVTSSICDRRLLRGY